MEKGKQLDIITIPKGKYSFLITGIPFIHDNVIAFCLTKS